MTREDLEQIGKLIETKLEAQREHTKKVVREEVEAEGKITRGENSTNAMRLEARIIKVENRLKDVEVSNNRLGQGQQETDAKIDTVSKEIKEAIHREAQTMADFFHDTWEKMDSSEERVTRLEVHTGLTTPHKN